MKNFKKKMTEFLFPKQRSLVYRLWKFFKGRDGLMRLNILGSQMYVNLKDKGLSVDLILDRVREPYSTAFLPTLLREKDIVLDIGANIGYYALYEAKIVGPQGRVYAMEPSPENFRILEKNIACNPYQNIDSFCLGAAEKEGVCEMHIYEEGNLNSMLARENRRVMQKITVPTVAVDGFLKDKKFPTFIRMDVEGFEHNIIQGMKAALRDERLRVLFIELHPHIMTKDQTSGLLVRLRESGFEIKKIIRSEGSNLKWALYKKLGQAMGGPTVTTIDGFLSNTDMLSGREGAFEVFFERVS